MPRNDRSRDRDSSPRRHSHSHSHSHSSYHRAPYDARSSSHRSSTTTTAASDSYRYTSAGASLADDIVWAAQYAYPIAPQVPLVPYYDLDPSPGRWVPQRTTLPPLPYRPPAPATASAAASPAAPAAAAAVPAGQVPRETCEACGAALVGTRASVGVQYEGLWHCSLGCALRRTHRTIAQVASAVAVVDEARSLERAKLSFAGTGIEELRVTLRDPMTTKGIDTPARLRSCAHFSCFDLVTFLSMFEWRPQNKWRCPICRGHAQLGDIVVDGLLAKIMQEPEGRAKPAPPPLVVHADGSHTWALRADSVSPAPTPSETPPARPERAAEQQQRAEAGTSQQAEVIVIDDD
eukprot:m51a1_g14217 putative e3 sumo-protein ligase pias4 (349) ;mRNA; f:182855-184293